MKIEISNKPMPSCWRCKHWQRPHFCLKGHVGAIDERTRYRCRDYRRARAEG